MLEDVDRMWVIMAECIRRSASEVLGMSRGCLGRRRGVSWWSVEVLEKVKAKQVAFKRMLGNISEEDRYEFLAQYKLSKNATKQVVAKAKDGAF